MRNQRFDILIRCIDAQIIAALITPGLSGRVVVISRALTVDAFDMAHDFLFSELFGALASCHTAPNAALHIRIDKNAKRLALACVFGSSLAMATPVATLTITMVQVAGYRFKDYLRMGGLVGCIGLVTAWAAIVLFYGLL